MIEQKEKLNLTSISECTDTEGKSLEQSVVRDTWRCHEIGKTYAGTVITTCNILEDRMREETNGTNINANCCRNNFLNEVRIRDLKINEVYVDSF